MTLQAFRIASFESGGFGLGEADLTTLQQHARVFAAVPSAIPVAQQRILITASTDDEGVSDALTNTLATTIDALASAPEDSEDALLYTLLQRALREWELGDVPGEAAGEQGDSANKLLAQARALSALRLCWRRMSGP